MENIDEKELFNQIKAGSAPAFEKLFYIYYASLCLFASQYVKNDDAAEELVQDVFYKVWSKRHTINIENSVKQYLFKAVKYQCINLLQHNRIALSYQHKVLEDTMQNVDTKPYFLEVGLRQKIERCILSLPEKRREIFKLSREEGLRYKEIAERLNISVKTVETQMGLALKQLREMLQDYNDYLIGLSIFFTKKQE